MKPLVAAAVLANLALSQTHTFEVASVKPNHSGTVANATGRGGSLGATPGRLIAENCSLWKLIGAAYGIGVDKDYAISGPDWLKSERFDLTAKAPSDATPQAMMEMLQNLLVQRFALKTHRESREMRLYALVSIKSGAKLKPVEDGGTSFSMGPGTIKAQKASMAAFVDRLSQFVDRPVIDATELTAVYNFTLEWAPEQPPPTPGEVSAATAGPSLFTAIQQQLGLRLEARKGSVPVLVVDHAERVPTGN